MTATCTSASTRRAARRGGARVHSLRGLGCRANGLVSACACVQTPLLGGRLARCHGPSRRGLAGVCAHEPRRVRPRAGARRQQRRTSGQQLPHVTLPAPCEERCSAPGRARLASGCAQQARRCRSVVRCAGCSSSRGHSGCSTVDSAARLHRAHRARAAAPRWRACWCCTARRCAPCASWPSAACWRSRRASRSPTAASTSRGAAPRSTRPERARSHRSRRCRGLGWPTIGSWSQAARCARLQSCLAACASVRGPLRSPAGR